MGPGSQRSIASAHAREADSPPPRRLVPLDHGDSRDCEQTVLAPPVEVDRRAALADLAISAGVAAPFEELQRRFDLPPTYLAPERRLVRIRDAWVEARMCLAFTADGRYVRDTYRTRRQFERNGYEISTGGELRPPDGPVVELEGPCVLVGLDVGGSYFHWLLEAFVRPLVAGDLLPPGGRFLVRSLPDWQRAALVMAGVSEEQIVELPDHGFVAVGDLYVPPRGATGGPLVAPVALTALAGLAGDDGAADRRLLVSRASARYRRLGNEKAALEALEPYGFELVQAERLSFAEQIDAFSHAEIVLGMHGAGLVNCTFCRPGARLVELQSAGLDEARLTLFWHIAAARGLRYAQLVCPDTGDKPSLDPSQRDLIVDVAALEAMVGRLVGTPEPTTAAEPDPAQSEGAQLLRATAEVQRLTALAEHGESKVERLEAKVELLQERIVTLRGRLGAYREVRRGLRRLRRDGDRIAASRSWRIGRGVTRLARRSGPGLDPVETLLRDLAKIERDSAAPPRE